MSQLVSAAGADGLPTNLHAELRTLIASSRQRLAGAVNAELTRLYWAVGQRLASEVLGGERAQYGSQLLEQLGQQLSQEFGRGFEARNLRRMVKFAQAFPSAGIVSTLSTKLSWSHMVAIVALKNPQARQFYAQQAAQDRWSVRELTHQIERKAFERTELAALQAPPPFRRSLSKPWAPAPPKSSKTRISSTFWACARAMTRRTWKPPSCASSKPSSLSWAGALRLWSGKSAWSSTARTFTWTCFSITAACVASWPSS